MPRKSDSEKQTNQELSSLENRLEETEEMLRAIRQYMVDAFVVTRENGEEIVTLGDAAFPYRMMVEAMNEGAVTLVADGTIMYGNPRFGEMVHFDCQRLIGIQFQNFIQPEQRAQFERMLQEADQGGRRGEFVFKTTGGKSLPVQLSMYRLGSDSTSGISILVTDISERVQSEEQIRRLASELTVAEHEERHRISQILHEDLQQRLFAIKAQLTFLKVDSSVPDAQLTLEQIQKSISDAITLTRDLSVDMSPSVLRGEGLAQSIFWLCARMKEQYGLQLNIRAADHLKQLDDHMRVLVFQTVRELLFNTVKHAGTLEASLLMERTGETGRITISDAGKGFDTNVLLHNPTGAHGILLLRDRLRLMHANLSIQSAPGQGTQVVIELPIAAS